MTQPPVDPTTTSTRNWLGSKVRLLYFYSDPFQSQLINHMPASVQAIPANIHTSTHQLSPHFFFVPLNGPLEHGTT
jgi:hypothetical protein